MMEELHARAERVERDAWLDLWNVAPAEVRESLGLESTMIDEIGVVGCRGIPGPVFNRAFAIGVSGKPTDDQLDRMIDWLDDHGTGWYAQIPPAAYDETVAECLDRKGAGRAELSFVKFVREAGDLPPLAPTTADIGPVDAGAAQIFGDVAARCFDLPPAASTWLASLVGRARWHPFLARVEGEPAGVGLMYVQGNAAWLGFGGTLPEFRGRGIQPNILAARLRAAQAMGVELQTVETSLPVDRDDPNHVSYRNQGRVGFRQAFVRPNYERKSRP